MWTDKNQKMRTVTLVVELAPACPCLCTHTQHTLKYQLKRENILHAFTFCRRLYVINRTIRIFINVEKFYEPQTYYYLNFVFKKPFNHSPYISKVAVHKLLNPNLPKTLNKGGSFRSFGSKKF